MQGLKKYRLILVCIFACSNLGYSEPGEGIQLGKGWSISPFIEAMATYDSNVLLRYDGYVREDELNEPEPDDDIYYDLTAGLSLIKDSRHVTANLRGLAQFRRYELYTDLDDDTVQQNFDAVIGCPASLEVELSQQYSHVSDYEFTREESGLKEQDLVALRLIETRTRRTDRYIEDYGVALAKDFCKVQARASLGYGSVEFGDDTPIYFKRRNLYDWEEYHGTLNLGFLATDKSAFFVTPSFGEHHSENGLANSSFTKFRVGLRTDPTIKINYNIGVGYQSYQGGEQNKVIYEAEEYVYVDTDPEMSTNGLDTTFFHYDGQLTWSATRKLDLIAYGRNEMIPTSAFVANTKRVDQGSIGARQVLWRRWIMSLGASYRKDTYTLPIDGVYAIEELAALLLKFEYDTRRKWLQLTAKCRYEEFTSNIQEDYQQLRASVSINLTY